MTSNPYAASAEAAQPRSWRNVWRLLISVGLIFVLPSLGLWVFLKREQLRPMLFQQVEDAVRDRTIEKWQREVDRGTANQLTD